MNFNIKTLIEMTIMWGQLLQFVRMTKKTLMEEIVQKGKYIMWYKDLLARIHRRYSKGKQTKLAAIQSI